MHLLSFPDCEMDNHADAPPSIDSIKFWDSELRVSTSCAMAHAMACRHTACMHINYAHPPGHQALAPGGSWKPPVSAERSLYKDINSRGVQDISTL